MIKSRRTKAGFWFLNVLVRHALKRRFGAIYVEGLENLRDLPAARPIIVCPNHHNWWDGFFGVYLAGLLPERSLFLVQEEKHLARYSFFKYAGAFGINLETPRASLPGFRHALDLLQKPGSLLWIFPEGQLTSPSAPFVVRGGAQRLAEKSGAAVVPLFSRIAWRDESWPSVLLSIGPVIPPDQISENLERLRSTSASFDDPLAPLPNAPHLRGRTSLNRTWDSATRQTPSS